MITGRSDPGICVERIYIYIACCVFEVCSRCVFGVSRARGISSSSPATTGAGTREATEPGSDS